MKVATKLLAILAFAGASLGSAILLIVVLTYPADAGLIPRKYDWILVPAIAGFVLPFSGGLGVVAYRWVRARFDASYKP